MQDVCDTLKARFLHTRLAITWNFRSELGIQLMLESQIANSYSSPDFLGMPLYLLQTVLFEKTNILKKSGRL